MSDEPNLDVSHTDVVDSRVAAILRAKSGMERLRLAHEAWELAHDRLTVFLAARNPEWDEEQVQAAVAKRL
ncbi:MAG: hypothetical protein ACXU95_16065, partial [Isosphaeraceae bacterium]